MTMLEELTPDELAGYHLKWLPTREAFPGADDDSPVLCYDHTPPYVLASDEVDELNDAIENGASPDDVILYLHELLDHLDGEAEARRLWYRRHPVRWLASRLGWHLSKWGAAPAEDQQDPRDQTDQTDQAE
jgi:hypothetical protein